MPWVALMVFSSSSMLASNSDGSALLTSLKAQCLIAVFEVFIDDWGGSRLRCLVQWQPLGESGLSSFFSLPCSRVRRLLFLLYVEGDTGLLLELSIVAGKVPIWFSPACGR